MIKPIKPALGIAVLAAAAGLWFTADRFATAADKPAAAAAGIREIQLPELAADWPDGPNRDMVEVQCGVCHSSRYVTMQPAFPRKTWEAQVDKMRKVFGAPINDDAVQPIVDYLVAVRGAREPAK